jgi:hypothetical protein
MRNGKRRERNWRNLKGKQRETGTRLRFIFSEGQHIERAGAKNEKRRVCQPAAEKKILIIQACTLSVLPTVADEVPESVSLPAEVGVEPNP